VKGVNVTSQTTEVSFYDQHALITGGTSGLGRASVFALARLGMKVHVVCRSAERGHSLNEAVYRACGAHIDVLVANLSSLRDVRAVAARYLATRQPLHVLIANAGVVNTRRITTIDGIEETFAVNHLAHFLLVQLLGERLAASAPARVVVVASDSHGAIQNLKLHGLEGTAKYRTMQAYARSKLANLLFVHELARRVRSAGVTVNAVHPGAVRTNLGRQNPLWGPLLRALLRPFTVSAVEGCRGIVRLATAPELANITGQYFEGCTLSTPKPWARSDELAEQLWTLSCSLTGIDAAVSGARSAGAHA
jgi:NAD(P)-dependent dehydrogenase (short-subunit alcohol dehydrogenase family)